MTRVDGVTAQDIATAQLMERGLFTARAAALHLGVQATTIRDWVARGHLPPAKRAAGTYVWTTEQLDRAKRREAQLDVPEQGSWIGPRSAACGCGCGGPVTITCDEETGWSVLTCAACSATMRVEGRSGTIPRSGPGRTPPPDPSLTSLQQYLRREVMRLRAESAVGSPSVYVIRLGEYVKIGKSTNIFRRITDLSLPGDSLLLVLPGSYDVEHSLHLRFDHHRAFGEWFYLRDDLLQFVIDEQAQVAGAALAAAGDEGP